MTQSDTNIELRGPILAAHRTFRQAIDSYSGEQKGRNVAASLKMRNNPNSMVAFQDMHHHLAAMCALGSAAEKFGKASAIPADDQDLAGYIRGQQKILDAEYNSALLNVSKAMGALLEVEPGTSSYIERARLAAQEHGRLDGWSFALLTFHQAFEQVRAQAEALKH